MSLFRKKTSPTPAKLFFFHPENLMRYLVPVQNPHNSILIRIRQEDLSKVLVPNKIQELRDSGLVQLVENVIQKKDGFDPLYIIYVVELRKFEGEGEGLLLPLRAEPLHRTSVHQEVEIVLVDAGGGVSGTEVGVCVL